MKKSHKITTGGTMQQWNLNKPRQSITTARVEHIWSFIIHNTQMVSELVVENKNISMSEEKMLCNFEKKKL